MTSSGMDISRKQAREGERREDTEVAVMTV